MAIVARRKHLGMSFDGLIEGDLEALRGLGTAFEIPCQGVLILGFRLGVDRNLSHLTTRAGVAGRARGPRTRVQAGPSRPRSPRSGAGSHPARPDRTAVRPMHLPWQGAPRRAPFVPRRARPAPPGEVLLSRGSLANPPLQVVDLERSSVHSDAASLQGL